MIRIDHMGVPARARLDAASFLTCLFAPVQVGSGFTIDFFDAEQKLTTPPTATSITPSQREVCTCGCQTGTCSRS
jgi:hypothetical protein